ncbi:hypothetical protein MMC25_000588 [Agyrium rufum]|nr:hypothetical protein [Agyrium rufum]
MSRKGTKRLVVCVDGTWFGPDGASSHGSENKSNVFRIYASIKEGRFTDQSGNTIIQSRQYFPGVGVGKPFLEKAMDGWTGDGCNDMILNIFQYICNNLTDSNDELWMFGFSRGAYVVRAVSSMLRYLRALSLPRNGEEGIDKEALKTYSMMRRDQADEIRRNSGKLYHFFRSRTRESPIIQFLGLFDTVKATNDHLRHDLSFSDNINHVRHALALNENRTLFAPELYEPFVNTNMSNHRSLIQAWFVGAHSDMGGGSAEDGLSLYPLQWMLIESRRIGLALEFLTEDSLASVFEDPIKLARVPALNPAPEAETGEKSKQEAWQFPYSNGIVVSMNDLRPSHNYGNLQGSPGTKLVKNRPVRQQHSVNETGSEDLRRSFFTKLRPLRSSRKDGRSSSRAVVTDDLPPISRHLIAINRGATYVLRGKDREVFEDGKLKGYLSTGER